MAACSITVLEHSLRELIGSAEDLPPTNKNHRKWLIEKIEKYFNNLLGEMYSAEYVYVGLKGQCHEIVECWFFHQIAPHGPIRGIYSRTTLIFAEYSQIYSTKSQLSGV